MRARGLTVAAVTLSAAAFFGASGRWPWHRLTGARLGPVAAPPAPTPSIPNFTETHDTLRRGETLSDLFGRHDVTIDFHHLDPSVLLDPRRVRAGLIFSFRRMLGDSAPSHITVRTSPEQRITFSRVADGWSASAEPIHWETQESKIEGVINNSLYEALDAGVSDKQLDLTNRRRLAWDLADVYAWQVDFTRDIQPGDHFQVAFERLVSEDGEVRVGRVLAGDLSISGKSLTAFRFSTDNGKALYFDANGNSLRRAFLRAPVQFRRISSNFARLRYHPILGLSRRHEGTDYAAAPGTPVMAAGDGVVLRAGRVGGYGNLVELRHMNGITTRYGHLRGFARGIHSGSRVEQGQIIGYVGSTGLATGPHLHYEFRVNGIPQDSRRVTLGSGSPVPAQDRAAFERERDRLLLLLHSDSTGAPSALARQAPEASTRWLP
jgi:murein DD-endopeptidase MepM/ murein hydrolase activator NlpD